MCPNDNSHFHSVSTSRRNAYCGRGHKLTPDNLYVRPNGNRQCRICKLEQNRAWRRGEPMSQPFTHCRQGHPWTDENTYTASNGSRQCVKCARQRGKKNYIANGGVAGRHGLSQDELLAIWERQEHSCGICGVQWTKQQDACIDHDHDTGEVRGLLCTRCNTALGKFGDNETLLLKALGYLYEHSNRIRNQNAEAPRVSECDH